MQRIFNSAGPVGLLLHIKTRGRVERRCVHARNCTKERGLQNGMAKRSFLFALLVAVSVELETTRFIVTFRSATYNTLEAAGMVPEEVNVVKQYGRRLVLLQSGNESIDIAGIWGEMVEMVEPDALVDGNDIPWHTDPSEPYGMHLDPVLTRRNASVVVALLDSGMAARAIDLWKPVGGYCFISSPDFTNTDLGRNPDFTDPGDQGPTCPTPTWHGTKVASVVKAVAPYAKLSVLRVLGRCGAGFASDVTDAIVWAAGGKIGGVKANPFPAKVISMSLAGRGPCPSFLQSAVSQAVGLGATLIAAAGNAGANATLYFPGNCKGVLSIGASTRQGTLAAYSNWGDTLAFSAPGGDGTNPVQVVGVGVDGRLVQSTAVGTSFAAPHVAGVLALMQVANVSLDQGGRYVPCVGGCGVKGILNGVINDQKLMKPIWLSHYNESKFSNNSQLFMADVSSCSYGYDTSSPQDRYGGAYSFNYICPLGTYVCSYAVRYTDPATRYVTFGCCDISPGWVRPKHFYSFGQPEFQDISDYLWTTDKRGYYDFSHHIEGSFIGVKDEPYWSLNFGTPSRIQQCRGDEIIVGFHGWYGTCLDEISIYCRRFCQCDPGYYTSDGECLACDSCASGFFELGACTSTTNRVCRLCTACADISYETSPCSAAQDRQCAICTTCTAGQQYQTQSCSRTQNRICAGCSQCSSTQYRTGCDGIIAGTCYNCDWCTAGKYLSRCSGNPSNDCVDCNAGSYCLGNYDQPITWTKTICSAGSYLSQSPSVLADGICTPCQPGDYCTGGTAARRNCSAGWHCSDPKTQEYCPPGHYCPQGTITPIKCNEGTYNKEALSGLIGECLKCYPGYHAPYKASTACSMCPAGTFSNASGNSACIECTSGFFQNTRGQTACQQCSDIKQPCKPGETFITCTRNTNAECSICPLIANCRYLNKGVCKDSDDRPTCLCEAGFEMKENECVQCPPGKYKPEIDTSLCGNWSTSTEMDCGRNAQYLVPGTRFKNSFCAEFPRAPENARVNPDQGGWTCNAGFE
jgi:hypothetical protein